ncbi:MAG TPA: ABC transporter substrate-binding protein [Bosea sp. (in: a-proteobacteria)]|jgi:NitT/TauT family transport system substrate-binding protein|uniref:ABC transporter substrate-binding protein n=1 Tax=Bosea sp. (in: a-proteobacteria) TaxID=1871050 RepID=UPI002E13BD1B|nr:ABC transporter substrate-binding protein [Bosea sp. (in: a-proteobacteria)]
MKQLLMAATAALALFGTATSALAEAKTLRVAKQYGLGYIQLMLMEDQKLVEKHAKAAGLGDVTVDWSTFRSSDVMNDALISGNLDFASLGPTGIITIWSRTRNNVDVRAASGLNAMAWTLNVRDPAIKSLKDFTVQHRIAVPAVKVSGQATALQIAAAKEWGDKEFEKLDSLTVSLSHPDATAMMLGGKSEIVANFSSPPFSNVQLKDPKIRALMNSDDILGGPISFNVIATTGKFRNDNPKLYGAFLAALKEATDIVSKDKGAAAEAYLRLTKDRSSKEELVAILDDKTTHITTDVLNLGSFTDFMGKVGRLKNAPADWKKEMLFPEATAR